MQKIEQLTFTRFVAAMAIVIFHFGLHLPVFSGVLGKLLLHADTGVSYFYVLSGFIMVVAYGQSGNIDFKSYLRNRVARIYPTYLTALFSHVVIAKLLLFTTLALNLLALQAWVPGKVLSINYPGWSISVEFFFYLLFPLLYNRWYSRARNILWVLVPVCVLWLGTQLFTHWYVQSALYTGKPSASHDVSHYLPLLHLNQFLIGNLFGLLYRQKWLPEKRYDGLLFLVALVIVGLLYAVPLNYHNGMLAWLFAAFIYLLAQNTGLLTAWFSRPALVYLGEISFAVYMYQLPVYLACLKLFGGLAESEPTWFFFSYILLLLLVSALSYRWLERTAQRWLRTVRLPFIG